MCSLGSEVLKKTIATTDYIAFCGGAGENARVAGEKGGNTRITPQVVFPFS